MLVRRQSRRLERKDSIGPYSGASGLTTCDRLLHRDGTLDAHCCARGRRYLQKASLDWSEQEADDAPAPTARSLKRAELEAKLREKRCARPIHRAARTQLTTPCNPWPRSADRVELEEEIGQKREVEAALAAELDAIHQRFPNLKAARRTHAANEAALIMRRASAAPRRSSAGSSQSAGGAAPLRLCPSSSPSKQPTLPCFAESSAAPAAPVELASVLCSLRGVQLEATPGGGALLVRSVSPGCDACGLLFVGDTVVYAGGVAVAQGISAATKQARELMGSSAAMRVRVRADVASMQGLEPDQSVAALASVRLRDGQKEYLCQWAPSSRVSWVSLGDILQMADEDVVPMWETFESGCSKLEVTVSRAPGVADFGVDLSGNCVVRIDPQGAAGASELRTRDVVVGLDGEARAAQRPRTPPPPLPTSPATPPVPPPAGAAQSRQKVSSVVTTSLVPSRCLPTSLSRPPSPPFPRPPPGVARQLPLCRLGAELGPHRAACRRSPCGQPCHQPQVFREPVRRPARRVRRLARLGAQASAEGDGQAITQAGTVGGASPPLARA